MGISLSATLMLSCSDNDILNSDKAMAKQGDVINVGGIDTGDEMTTSSVVTRSGDGDDTTPTTPVVDPTGAEKQEWLIQPLKQGLDITYGLVADNDAAKQERVAILKLLGGTINDNNYNTSTEGYAEYSFNYRGNDGTETEESAIWHDNGAHYFEGVHVPNRLRYTTNVSELEQDNRTINGETNVKATHDLNTDQHDGRDKGSNNDLGNYTLLTHYLGMPANTRIAATVSRIKLPFQHRLSRVMVYVLIDPTLGKDVKIDGFTPAVRNDDGTIVPDENGNIWREDPTTSAIRFCNVEVLAGVHDVYDSSKKLHTLTPQWTRGRKVIPHFFAEDGTWNDQGVELNKDFIMYTDIATKENIFGTNKKWPSAHTAYTTKYNAAKTANPDWTEAQLAEAAEASGYRQTNYGKAPMYDIIVRPTYTNKDNIMYDEGTLTDQQKTELVNHTNSIDFEIKLNNGLEYEKHFEFDLNPNYQTAVYLLISREQVNYDTSGSELWVARKDNDDWYGIDNANGNTLSLAGSSWQRAYSNKTDTSTDITDGHYYGQDDEGTGQNVSDATFKEFLAQAYKGGKHHGDYFILDNDITINASELPADFIFTGHLDGRDHTITFTGGSSDVYEETTKYELYPTTKLYINEDSQYKEYEFPTALYICKEVAQAKPVFYRGATSSSDTTIPGGEGKMILVSPHPTLAQVMANDIKYYTKDNDTYSLFVRPTKLYTHRTGASSLFCGLNGTYTTNQESANPQKDSDNKVIWEANVHKETNKSTQWVPLSGWRGEVINVKVKTGTLFPSETYTCTGNVRNCYDVDATDVKVKAYTNIPELPKYK